MPAASRPARRCCAPSVGGDRLRVGLLEGQRQRAVLELVGELVADVRGEAAGDLRVGRSARPGSRGAEMTVVVQHHGDQAVLPSGAAAARRRRPSPALLEGLAGQRGPLLLAVAGEVEARPPTGPGAGRAAGGVADVGAETLATSSSYLRRRSAQATTCWFGVVDRAGGRLSSWSQVIVGTLNCICGGSARPRRRSACRTA